MSDGSLEVRRLRPVEDSRLFRQLAEIHQEEITAGFLSTLGPDFLERLYRFIAASRHAFIFAATGQGQARGFICGSLNTNRLYRDLLLRHGWELAPRLLPRIFSVARLRRLKETLFYPQKRECRELPVSEILNFCVRRRYQRQGIARLLFKYLVAEFKSFQIEKIKIVTGEQQTSAQAFYQAMHARQISDLIIHDGTLSHVFIYDID